MTRWWNELVADLTEVVPLPLLVIGLTLLAIIAGSLLYFWPAWVPRRWPRLTRRSRKRSSSDHATEEEPTTATEAEADEADTLADLPVAVFVSLADQFAAEGRFPEAIRERLRALVRDLVDHGVVDHRPGSTVTELAATAGTARPDLAAPTSEATGIFSDTWYGMFPAAAGQDERMRALVGTVHDLLSVPSGSTTAGGRR